MIKDDPKSALYYSCHETWPVLDRLTVRLKKIIGEFLKQPHPIDFSQCKDDDFSLLSSTQKTEIVLYLADQGLPKKYPKLIEDVNKLLKEPIECSA